MHESQQQHPNLTLFAPTSPSPDGQNSGAKPDTADSQAVNPPRDEVALNLESEETADDLCEPPADLAIIDSTGRLLTNFTVIIDEVVEVDDDSESHHYFKGRLRFGSIDYPLQISAADFASDQKLRAMLYEVGGPGISVHCSMNQLRAAISAAIAEKPPRNRKITRNFGWTHNRESYLLPNGRITPNGYEPSGIDSGLILDMSGSTLARHLDLRQLPVEELLRVKRHIVVDLLALNEARVTYSLLATVALAVLFRGVEGMGRFALWLVGPTGVGKSFLGRLFQNFFGTFSTSQDQIATWGSTSNYIQAEGYYFRDAIFLVDDFKPELVAPKDAVRILQQYGDGTARGRLVGVTRQNQMRSIRGWLVSTGQTIPERSASALARCIIVPVHSITKDIERGDRCQVERPQYSGVTADFIRYLLANGRMEAFVTRVGELKDYYFRPIAGEINDLRIGSNLALLAASFEEIARYLADVWPDYAGECTRFVEHELVAMRGVMLKELKEQEPIGVFLKILAEMIEDGEVAILDRGRSESGRVIGKQLRPGILQVSTHLSLTCVQETLRRQRQPALPMTPRTLLSRLRSEGKLLAPNGMPLSPHGHEPPTSYVRLAGPATHCFLMRDPV
jgi:hypothetical protein